MGKMTRRERVIAALNHKEPDRVPIDFGAHYNTTINALAYNRVKKALGIESPTYIRQLVAMLATPSEEEGREALEALGSDFFEIPRIYADGCYGDSWKEWLLKDGSKAMVPSQFNPTQNEDGSLDIQSRGQAVYHMPKGGFYFDRVAFPYSDIDSVDQLKSMEPSYLKSGGQRMSDEEVAALGALAKKMYEETDYALMGNTYPMWTFHIGLEMFGYHKFFLLMAAQPEIVHAWMDMSTNAWLATMDKYLDAVGPYIVAIVVGDDYGTQRAPMISPKMFRELFKPSLAKICDFVHKKSPNVKVLLHSCGAVAPLIPDFIDAGLDALNPVQTTAEGMDPAKLKAEYGRDLVFWGGGVRCQTTLANGTVEDVRSEVRELLEIWKPGGGYIFAPDHDIQENVPAEKIIALYETAQKYGGY